MWQRKWWKKFICGLEESWCSVHEELSVDLFSNIHAFAMQSSTAFVINKTTEQFFVFCFHKT